MGLKHHDMDKPRH